MRILTQHAGDLDACQWYRGVGPLTSLAKSRPDIQIIFSNVPTWAEIKSADVLFLLRPCLQEHLSLIERAKNLGTKVWIDLDDDLLNVPSDNPSIKFFSTPAVQMVIEKSLQAADVITVSTDFLKNRLIKFNKNIRVIRNALDENLLKHRTYKVQQNNFILWRGTATHQRDLMEYSTAIKMVSVEQLNTVWGFVGYDPWFITEELGARAVKFPVIDMFQFHQALCGMRPKITIVPLHDSGFNRSKSNIAALEASLAGSAVLAPAWQEWTMPGVYTYENATEFADKLTLIIKNDVTSKASMTWKYIQENLLLTHSNALRLKTLESLR
jgi:hypothetical protein